MFSRKLWTIGAILLAIIVTAGPTLAADQITFTGDVTYRERIALPPDADLTVTLVSVDADGVPHAIGATAPIEARGQVPLHFVLNVRSDAITDEPTYGLIAEIRASGVPLFRNRDPVPVDPALPLPTMIIVNFDPQPPPPAPGSVPVNGELEVTPALFDTIWQVRNINGHAVHEATEVSLSIASDRRAGGNGGCNSYFTEAMFDGPALRFGPVAGTRMACDMPVMRQEADYFAALEATASYELADHTLYLLDAEGNPVVRLVRQ
ncbi:putative lipoprotein [Devosia sp. UYZn731]|uniref:META domain-containing protein n=1 Tax=Devosia sp. UYZn731 TaxID=3156345 RepID=UPI00339240BD